MSQRIGYIDTAKLIGLALVCFCHIPHTEGDFHIWAYSFHMPLFFLLSGLFFRPEKFSLKSTAMQLLIPFFFFNILIGCLPTLINLILYRQLVAPDIHFDEWLMSKYTIGPSWFLVSLFCIRVVCHYVHRWTHGVIGIVVLSIVAILLFVFTYDAKFWQVLSLGSTVLGLPFYVIGYLLKDSFAKTVSFGGLWLTIALVILSVLAVFNEQVGMHENSYGKNILLFFIFALTGSFSIVRLSQYIPMPKPWLEVFMGGAMMYLCLHTFLFEYIILAWNKLTNDFSGNTLTEKIVVTILTFVVIYPLSVFMLKYCPILLGRTKKKVTK